MSYLTPAQAAAQFISLLVFIAAGRWYVIPWLNTRPRADALIALLWVHVFRYVALQVFSAQRTGTVPPEPGRMPLAVVFDAVAAARDVAYELRKGRRAFTDAKKARLCAVGIEQLEHTRCDVRIRPIVERQRHVTASRRPFRQPHNVLAEQPAPR